ncbi:hypothetical protein Tco_0020132 [Tanacetum coccineum]
MPVSRQHCSKHFIDESVDHLFTGLKLEILNSQDQIYFRKSSDKGSLQIRNLLQAAKRLTKIVMPYKSEAFRNYKFGESLAYRLELPEKLSSIHNTFHVSNLKKCLSDESLVIPIKELQLDDKLNFGRTSRSYGP